MKTLTKEREKELRKMAPDVTSQSFDSEVTRLDLRVVRTPVFNGELEIYVSKPTKQLLRVA